VVSGRSLSRRLPTPQMTAHGVSVKAFCTAGPVGERRPRGGAMTSRTTHLGGATVGGGVRAHQGRWCVVSRSECVLRWTGASHCLVNCQGITSVTREHLELFLLVSPPEGNAAWPTPSGPEIVAVGTSPMSVLVIARRAGGPLRWCSFAAGGTGAWAARLGIRPAPAPTDPIPGSGASIRPRRSLPPHRGRHQVSAACRWPCHLPPFPDRRGRGPVRVRR
jgi:hypothetical protein